MSDIISKAKVQYDVEKHRGILSAQGLYAESNVLEHLLKKIESGAFDVAVDADVPGADEIERMLLVEHPIPVGVVTRSYRALIAKLAEKDAEIERLREKLIRAEEARGSILISREQWEKDLYLIWGRSDAP